MILADTRPNDEGEFIEFAVLVHPAPPAAASTVPTGGISPSGPHVALDDSAPEAGPPESFEVCP